MVEHLTCNQTVVGSIPTTGSKNFIEIEQSVKFQIQLLFFYINGKFAERPNATDCKSVDYVFGGSNPPLPTKQQAHPNGWAFCFSGVVCSNVRVGNRSNSVRTINGKM